MPHEDNGLPMTTPLEEQPADGGHAVRVVARPHAVSFNPCWTSTTMSAFVEPSPQPRQPSLPRGALVPDPPYRSDSRTTSSRQPGAAVDTSTNITSVIAVMRCTTVGAR